MNELIDTVAKYNSQITTPEKRDTKQQMNSRNVLMEISSSEKLSEYDTELLKYDELCTPRKSRTKVSKDTPELELIPKSTN